MPKGDDCNIINKKSKMILSNWLLWWTHSAFEVNFFISCLMKTKHISDEHHPLLGKKK